MIYRCAYRAGLRSSVYHFEFEFEYSVSFDLNYFYFSFAFAYKFLLKSLIGIIKIGKDRSRERIKRKKEKKKKFISIHFNWEIKSKTTKFGIVWTYNRVEKKKRFHVMFEQNQQQWNRIRIIKPKKKKSTNNNIIVDIECVSNVSGVVQNLLYKIYFSFSEFFGLFFRLSLCLA